ncbi:MAG: hypothetical protein BHW58_09555 [Azospirillum sp. 51_20]|jgi:MoaA/NifB/PqqE/SkfB family radical SAM enzyme|nr:MAG: hypothetical protein BHW58_09555 [Azospirillum sp. 51_20]
MLGKLKQIIMLLRIMATPQITRPPLSVLQELRKRGKKRLPSAVWQEIDDNRKLKTSTFAFARELLSSECISRHDGKYVVNSFLPPFPGRAYERMFTNLLSGRKLSPVSAYIAVTKECPYNCWHCSFKGHVKPDLPTSRQLVLTDDLCRLGASIIGFTGGEPLQHKNIADLIKRAATGGAAVILFTTGCGLDEERARKLKKAGLWAICFSLDSSEPEIHNRLRGRKTAFDEVMSAVKAAKGAGLYTMVSSVATPRFMQTEDYRNIYQLAVKLKVNEYRIVEAMPCGKLLDNDETVISAEDVKTLRAFHRQINSRSPRTKVCAFNQIESPELFGCGAGTQHMFIDNAGEVCPCDFTPLSFGNVVREPLETVWLRMNEAFMLPRRHCFIQKNHRLIAEKIRADNMRVPLDVNSSLEICRQCPFDEMPDYFKTVYKP